MQQKLTDRQRLLMKRLITLGDWANSNELPVCLMEIRGFGSFFRGKPRPRDVDLLIKVDNNNNPSDFTRLIELLESIRYDWDVESQFSTPGEAIAELVAIQDPRATVIARCNIKRLIRWVAPYSWNMLRPQGLATEFSFSCPNAYAKRLIKSRLPNINVLNFMGSHAGDKLAGMRCGFTVSVWSQDRPDTAANLDALMTAESMRMNALLERAYFVDQLPRICASVKLREAEISLLKKIPTQPQPAPHPRVWFDEFAKDHPDLAEATSDLAASTHIPKDVEQNASSDEGTSLDDLAAEVDDIRKKLKYLYTLHDQLEVLRNTLITFRSGAETFGLSIDEFAVYKMMKRGSQSAKLKCKKFLESVGYPVDEITRRLSH